MNGTSESRGGLRRAAFVERFGGVYECSPWVAERAFDADVLPAFLSGPGRDPAGELRSLAEARELGVALAATVAGANEPARLALIRAHPDLVGRAALAGSLTGESTAEQASAGLDRCSADELERFRRANALYRERFGFPFVMAVRGASRADVLAAFERRLENDRESEFRIALAEIERIALLRLETLVPA